MAQKGPSGDVSAALGLALRPRYWPPPAPPAPLAGPRAGGAASAISLSLRLPHPTRPPPHTPSSVTGAGGPCHPGSMSYLSGDQQLPEGSFGGAGALSCVPCALNSCSRAPPACSIQVAGRGDSCSPDLSTSAHAPLGRTGVPGRPGPPPTWRSHPSPSSHPLLLPRLTIGGEVCGPRTQVPARQRPCAPCCVMECPLLLGLERGQQTPV
uniref:Uncharacterized protein n=1 Tax=Rousettus aegyptiacus TaxID=9407 RepID=A0A7J8IL24_ROUAE|nr:hypothetical protein HJG63_010517 [Rousettus aegyptiacus]